MTTATLIGSVYLYPPADRDGAIVRVDNNHAIVTYLTDLYPADGFKVIVALLDANGVQVDTWTSPETYNGQFWTGGSATGLYHLADGKILLFRSDEILGSSPPGYDLKAYEFDFSASTGVIPEPTIHVLASEVNPPGSANDPKWSAGGVGSDSGVVLFRVSGDYSTITMHWYEWGSGALSSAFQTITGLPVVGAGGSNSKIKWTNLGGGKALFHRTKAGGGATGVTVDLVTASDAGISLTTVKDLDWSVDYNAFGPGTPKVPGQSAFTAYGANEFVLIDTDYFPSRPFASGNSTDDYDAGLWNNIGDGYAGVVAMGGSFVLVQNPTPAEITESGSIQGFFNLYLDSGDIIKLFPPVPWGFALGGSDLIGVAAGYSTIWIVEASGAFHTARVNLVPGTADPGSGRIRFAG